jgi:hypothetical protein
MPQCDVQEIQAILHLPTRHGIASITGMEPESGDAKERINSQVAVTVAIVAAFMAVTKVTDDNVCQAMDREKAHEVNAWSYFQSKSVKQNLAELGHDQLKFQAVGSVGDARSSYEAEIKRYEQEIERYKSEKRAIEAEAKAHKKNYEALNHRDDQFDLSDATLSIALGMLAVTALAGKRWLLVASWGIGGFGALMGIAGLARIGFKVDWLVKLLS